MRRTLLLLLAALVAMCVAKSFDSESILQRPKRNALQNANRYTDGVVNYFFGDAAATADDKPMDPDMKSKVKVAMKYISDRTCVQFIRSATTNNRIVFRQSVAAGAICTVTANGKEGAADTVVILVSGAECTATTPLIVRSLMIAMGYVANSARPDAATYLTPDLTLINATVGATHAFATTLKGVAAMAGGVTPAIPFEYGSILSYSFGELADPSKQVFKAKTPNELYQYTMGTGRVTFADMKMINDNECTGASACATTFPGTAKCQNEGYPNPASCTECNCPEGYGSTECSISTPGIVSQRTQGSTLSAVATPQKLYVEFGQDKKLGVQENFKDRVDWITAPAGKKVEITILSLAEQCDPGCKFAGLEIKTVDRKLAGMRLCCKEHLNKPIVSALNPTPLIFYNRFFYTNFLISYKAV